MNRRRVGDVAIAFCLALIGTAVAGVIVLRALTPDVARPVTR